MRSSVLARLAGLLVAVQLPVAVAAAVVHDDAPDRDRTEVVEGGGDLLARAADRTAAATHYRFELSMSIETAGVEVLDGLDLVLGTGAQAGDRSQFLIDQSSLMEDMGGPTIEGASMEMITDGSIEYLRAPLFAALAEQGGETLPPELQPLADLGDRWGRIDLAAVGAASGVPNELIGRNGMDPQSTLDMLTAASGRQEPAGTDEIRGDRVTVYEAKLTFDDLMATGGMSFDDLRAFMPTVPSDEQADVDALFDAMGATPFSLSVAVDDQGLVRRATMTFDELFEAMGEAAGPPGGFPDITMSQSIEFFDFGDSSITIEPPAVEDTVDLTSWALEMADAFS